MDSTAGPSFAPGSGGRAAALGVALSAGSAAVAVGAGSHATRLLDSAVEAPPPSFGLEVLCAGGAALAAAWLSVLLLGGAACARGRHDPVRRAAEALAPRATARIAAALIGSVALVSSAGAAHAGAPSSLPVGTDRLIVTAPSGPLTVGLSGSPPPPATERYDPSPAPGDAPAPGWRPTSPPGRQAADRAAITLVSRGSAEPDSVVVRAGDTLWAITARHLGTEADAAAIAEEWPRWHEANRKTIGDNPDLLLPGTVLVPPESTARGVAS